MKEEDKILIESIDKRMEDLRKHSKRSDLPSPTILKFSKAERFDG
jgi:hypothetical protein